MDNGMKLSKNLLVAKILSKPQSAVFLGWGRRAGDAVAILCLSVEGRERAVGKRMAWF